MSVTTINPDQAFSTRRDAVARSVRKQWLLRVLVVASLLVYLGYIWFDFDVPGLIAKAQPDRAALLAIDSVAYKVHVTEDLRRGGTEISVEGERTAVFKTPPDWVQMDGKITRVDLGDGYLVEMHDKTVDFEVPDYGTINVRVTTTGVEARLPGPPPDWLRISDRKFDARPTIGKRVQVSRAKIEIHRYYLGWENFFFPFSSELNDYSFPELLSLAFSDDRLVQDKANWRHIFDSFWGNPEWQHGNVFIAMLETILMAVLGTLTATFVGLPLAFLAAANFTPTGAVRFAVRRLFDLLRGIDMLIWSLIFIRAFGLGPLTGALAIAFTDTGSLGKLFSEALENIDRKQEEGVSATGASRLQRWRFGVIPQILPVFVSQGLYYLESNTRSATVIGALGAGGIGLVLVETMRTSRDWENTTYIIILVIALVIVMDGASGWLRRRLIQGRASSR